MSEEINYVGDTGGDVYLDVSFYKNFFNGEEADFVKISLPGDKTLTIDTIAEPSHKARFKRQWDAYIGYRDMTGMPISEWDEISESLKMELGYQGFKFVEQVAGAPDQAFARMMGGVQIRTKAQSFLNRGKVDADVVIAKQGEQIQELTEKLDLLMQSMNSNTSKK
jgi:hypothetical protein